MEKSMIEEAMENISRELWGENLWFRRLDGEDEKAVCRVIALIRMNRIRAMLPFKATLNKELDAILANPGSFGMTERQEVPHD